MPPRKDVKREIGSEMSHVCKRLFSYAGGKFRVDLITAYMTKLKLAKFK